MRIDIGVISVDWNCQPELSSPLSCGLMSSGLIAVTVYFGTTMDQGVDNLQRNLLTERLSGEQVFDPWVPVIPQGLAMRHKATAISELRFQFSKASQKIRHFAQSRGVRSSKPAKPSVNRLHRQSGQSFTRQ